MKLSEIWYSIVAPSLLREVRLLRRIRDLYEAEKLKYDGCKSCFLALNKKFKELKRQNRELRQENKNNPMGAVIDVNRGHASKMRIRDLESQLRKNGIEPQ